MDKMNLPGRMLGKEFCMRERFVGQACIKNVNGNNDIFIHEIILLLPIQCVVMNNPILGEERNLNNRSGERNRCY